MSTRIMQDIIIVLKSVILICITWFTELFIGSIITLSFIPINIREFFEEVKTPIAVLVSISIFILTIIRIIKESANSGKK